MTADISAHLKPPAQPPEGEHRSAIQLAPEIAQEIWRFVMTLIEESFSKSCGHEP
jgi:hypothetical protein